MSSFLYDVAVGFNGSLDLKSLQVTPSALDFVTPALSLSLRLTLTV
jgi:hypothetical protein